MPSPKHTTIPTLSNLRLLRYATGWGHTPAEYAKALAAGKPTPLKTTTHPITGKPFVSVYRTTLAMPSSSKRADEPDSIEVVVKVNPLPTLGKKLQSLFNRTKHHRQWRGHELLQQARVHAAEPLAILHAQALGGAAEVLILKHAKGRTLLERFADHQDGLPMPQLIAPALAQTIARLEQHRLWNRDPKPSNIVVHQPTPESVVITLLDTVGIQKRSTRRDELLKHVLGLLLLETGGAGVPLPPQFAVDLARSTLQLTSSAKRSANNDTLDARVDEMLLEVSRSIAEQRGTPTDNPLGP